MTQLTITETVGYISTLFEDRLRIKGPSLERQIYKAGRKIPRRVRNSAKKVNEISGMVDHPKLSRMIDEKAFDLSAQVVITHLEAIDPHDVAVRRLLGVLAKISTVLILAFVVGVWYLWSRGLV